MNAHQANIIGNRLLDLYCRARLANDAMAAALYDLEWRSLWADIFYQYKENAANMKKVMTAIKPTHNGWIRNR